MNQESGGFVVFSQNNPGSDMSDCDERGKKILQHKRGTTRKGGSEMYLWFYQDQIYKQHNIIMLDVLVGKQMTVRTLRQANAFAQRAIIGSTMDRVERGDGVTTIDAYGHRE